MENDPANTRFVDTIFEQFVSMGHLFRALLDPETEGALWFIVYSAVLFISIRLLFRLLQGTALHTFLVRQIIKIMAPKMTKDDWPHDETWVVPPKSGKHESTLFFLHGLGDGSGYWEKGVDAFGLENTKIILPNAPILPVSVNMNIQMPAWYDIFGLDIGSAEDDDGIMLASRKLAALVAKEMEEYGIPANKIVLGGFSQGGALCLHTAYREGFLDEKILGVFSMASYMPRFTSLDSRKDSINPVNKNTRGFLAHGTEDTLVQFLYGKRTAQELQQCGVPVTFKHYEGVGHVGSEEMLADIKVYLHSELGL